MLKNSSYGKIFTRIGRPFRILNGSSKYLLLLLVYLISSPVASFASENTSLSESTFALSTVQAKRTVSGLVVDEDGNPLTGVTIIANDTGAGSISDTNGEYTIAIVDENTVLSFSFLGFEPQETTVGSRRIITTVMKVAAQQVEDVVVVGFGTQRKESLISAVTTVRPSELKGPTGNLTTMFSGKIAGMISYQRSGEPGKDNAEFFIRGLGTFGSGKVDPLILIDGIESSNTDLARLQPDDIADFSVLKDATASAVYGARGANGVILVNTKSGFEGKTKFNFRAENSFSSNTRNFQFADNITYMELANEASLTRSGGKLIYPQSKIDNTRLGKDPILYPSNNWIDQLIKPYTANQRFNANLSGGGKVARYYLAGTFNIDNGVLRNDPLNNFKNNISLKNYSIRSNTDINLTKTTIATVRVYAQFDDYSGPIGGGEAIFKSALTANPVAFPAVYPQSYSPNTKHIMFGSAPVPNSSNELLSNPYASMVSGYQENFTSTVNAQIEFKEDFSWLLPGLSARVMGYTQRYALSVSSRSYKPFYYKANVTSNGVVLSPYNDGLDNSIGTPGEDYLSYDSRTDADNKKINSAYYGEAVINYDRTFADKHAVTGMLIGTIRHSVVGIVGGLEASLPSRNLGLSGRFTYGYDSRYLLEFNFGYNGSERFAAHNRWGFFPSVGGGWIISNEKFFAPAKRVLRELKLRASYGLIGNDQIGNASDRFFYMSNVNLNNSDRSYTFGQEFGYSRPGIYTTRYENMQIGWEESRQINLGLDANIAGVNLIVEVYKQNRSNILLNRSNYPDTFGLHGSVAANTGKAVSKGIDISVDYNKFFGNGFWTQMRGNFTYATNKITVYDEPGYVPNEWYRSRVGYHSNQTWGYVAERLFVDDYEIANSPSQFAGNYDVAAGDIKYRDINGDGKISPADMVPIGHPTTPEINYGFGGTIGYKNFDFSFFFQGSARSSIFIDPKGAHDNTSGITPFANLGGGKQNGLLKIIADSHWSEDNRNLYAFWPRLSTMEHQNNSQVSTWWMRNGAMLRLKSVEVGYNLSDKNARKIGMSTFRVYVSATNLFVISKFKLWDPEMGSNGLGYPVQRVFNIGLTFGI